MFLSLPLSNGFGTGLLSSAFIPPKTKANAKWGEGQRGRIWEGKGWGVERVKGKEKQVASTREREQIFKAKHPKGGEKERRAKLPGHNFFLFFFSFFFLLERSSKARFYGIVLQSGSVKSSQVKSVRQEEEQGEQGEKREKREGEKREAGVVCTCARVSVCM